MINVGGFYKTLNGDVGQVVAAASIDYALKDDFYFENHLSLCQVRFDNGKNEWWLSNQLEEVLSPEISLLEGDAE